MYGAKDGPPFGIGVVKDGVGVVSGSIGDGDVRTDARSEGKSDGSTVGIVVGTPGGCGVGRIVGKKVDSSDGFMVGEMGGTNAGGIVGLVGWLLPICIHACLCSSVHVHVHVSVWIYVCKGTALDQAFARWTRRVCVGHGVYVLDQAYVYVYVFA